MTTETKTIELYTSAPAAYDGFSTATLAVVGKDRKGNDVRRVTVEPRDYDWQTARYDSGLCSYTNDRVSLEDYVRFGDWTLLPEPVPVVKPASCFICEDCFDPAVMTNTADGKACPGCIGHYLKAISAENCPGCGKAPGEGLTESCEHRLGCGAERIRMTDAGYDHVARGGL